MTVKKWTIARRAVQIGVIALIASPLFSLAVFRGNLAAGELLGLGLADPLAVIQATLASRLFMPSFFGAALLVAALYFATGGRSFCGWVCPVYLLTELGDRLRSRLGTAERLFSCSGIRWSFGITLVLCLLTGLPLFEVVSPIGIVSRAIMFKAWFPLFLVVAILAVETGIGRRVWCRSLCPVGGFYSLLGRYSPLRIGINRQRCTECGECSRVCPVSEVLVPALTGNALRIVSGDCTRCGACIDACDAKALQASVGYRD